MSNPGFSKPSKASRMASAADRDAKEARLQEAVSDIRNGTYSSIRQAAEAYNVPEATLRHRYNGRRPKKDAQMGMQTLPPDAESALVDLIRRSACSGYPLMPASIRDRANVVSCPVPGRSESVDVGRNWMQGFLLRHPSIWSCWSRCLENARLNAANETSIRSWYQRFAEVVNQFNVSSTDIYNMDETGFMFGQGGSERVVVPVHDPASRFRAQPGTRESATVIECIGSGGQVLPLLVITKGWIHTVREHQHMEGVPTSWHFSKSANGWTSNALAVEWLENVFDLNTKLSTSS